MEHGVDEREDGPGGRGGVADGRHHADGLHAELAEDGDVGLAAEEPECAGSVRADGHRTPGMTVTSRRTCKSTGNDDTAPQGV